MKKTLPIAAAILFMAAAFIAGCEDSGQKLDKAETSVVEATRDLEIAKSEIHAEIQLFRNENTGKLAVNNRSIAEIRTGIGKHDLAARSVYEKRINELDLTNRELQRRLDTYNDSLSVNWINFKDNFNSDMNNLRNALDNFFSAETKSNNQ
ncbi:MAG: hypothetical protein LC662_04280 [Rhodothermaceae bacterium]|nr:hypothetical protein [Rhodothermaceae bacterium]